MERHWWKIERVLQIVPHLLILYVALLRPNMVLAWLYVILIFLRELVIEPLAEKNSPERYRKYIRSSRPLYQALHWVVILTMFFVPSIVTRVMGKFSVNGIRIMLFLLYALNCYISYRDYLWRVMDKSTIPAYQKKHSKVLKHAYDIKDKMQGAERTVDFTGQQGTGNTSMMKATIQHVKSTTILTTNDSDEEVVKKITSNVLKDLNNIDKTNIQESKTEDASFDNALDKLTNLNS